MSVNNKRRLVVHGQVAPGYEPVRNLFTQNVTTLEEDNAQLCIYVRGKCVVDLWASKIGRAHV